MSHAPAEPPRVTRRLPAVEERSAGGVVVDVHEGEARMAVIARRNRAGRVEWCLPKGHIEGAETLPQTAAREVAEETGIEGLRVALPAIDVDRFVDDEACTLGVEHVLDAPFHPARAARRVPSSPRRLVPRTRLLSTTRRRSSTESSVPATMERELAPTA